MTDSLPRTSGLLLPAFSLPGPFGIGDLGTAADRWVDALARAGQSWWQVLPLGPTGGGDSPYTATSTFAGNPLLISPEALRDDGLVSGAEVDGARIPWEVVDYDQVRGTKEALLARAWDTFKRGGGKSLHAEFRAFETAEAAWLNEFALFTALKQVHGGVSWRQWPREVKFREAAALKTAREANADRIGRVRFEQFLWHRQWDRLRKRANSMGVKIMGDMPIFVADDSADVWAEPRNFLFDADRAPLAVAGVPPDYFAKDGQLWGNPLYDWAALKTDGYAWWTRRIRHAARLFDLTRLDHFRAFAAAWHVSPTAKTAKDGGWVPGPGLPFFEHLRNALGSLPLVAEDLGLITHDVHVLRRATGVPGMRVLQFAFGSDAENPFLPHNYDTNTVVYTGTHDNDTTTGWWQSISDHERKAVRDYIRTDGRDIAWDLIRVAWSSVAEIAIAPVQDILILGSEARVNTPGVAKGNWRWRLAENAPLNDRLVGLRGLSVAFNRVPSARKPDERLPAGVVSGGKR